MVDDELVTDLVDLLERRSELLEHLRAEPREKRVLVETLAVPRSTLDRAVRELEAAGLITHESSGYALTPLGERLLDEFAAFRTRVGCTVELEPVLRWIPPGTLDLDLQWLTDADCWTPEPNDPWAMVNRHVRALESTERVRGILPLVALHGVEVLHERVLEADADAQFVVEPGVAETLRTDETYAPLFRDLQARKPPTFIVADDRSIPYFLGVFDDELVQIGVDEESEPRALLESRDERVLEWARETIEEYQQAASPIADATE